MKLLNLIRSASTTATAAAAKGGALAALWTFPSVLLSAFIIAWEAGKDLSKTHLVIANFTGSLRLLVGLGWPLIYFVAWFFNRRKNKGAPLALTLEDEHSIEVFGLLLPILYFIFIWWKSTLTIWDAIPLSASYFIYLWVLWKIPPREQEEEALEEIGVVPRKILSFGPRGRALSITFLFLAGGALLYFTAHPFVQSMLAIAVSLNVSQFVFVQWVAPFLSEFPEKVSAFYWARRVTSAHVALMNMVSSNINQWSILTAMIPIIFVISVGRIQPIVFDAAQRQEILLTILQSLLGFILLLNLELVFYEALVLFAFWFIQFALPSSRETMIWVYLAWCLFELSALIVRRKPVPAWVGLRRTLARRFA